jgi:hypothetical protein
MSGWEAPFQPKKITHHLNWRVVVAYPLSYTVHIAVTK